MIHMISVRLNIDNLFVFTQRRVLLIVKEPLVVSSLSTFASIILRTER